MDEHISALREARQSYKDAFEAMLAECDASRDHGTENTDIAMERAMANHRLAYERYISASRKAREFFNMMKQQISKQLQTLQTKSVDVNAAELAPVTANDAPPIDSLMKDQRDLDSEARYEGAADMSVACNTTLPQAFADLGLYGAELEELLEHNPDLPDP